LDEWKKFLYRYKWMPVSELRKRFGIKKHDFDNLMHKPKPRAVLAPWRISLDRSPEELRKILTSAWQFYLESVLEIPFDRPATEWVPKIISLKNISRGSGYFFLTASKYLKTARKLEFEEYQNQGFTNIALALYEFWPGYARLRAAGVEPYMFFQTKKEKILEHFDAKDMVEHIYMRFFSGLEENPTPERIREARELFYAFSEDQEFLTSRDLNRFGITPQYYVDVGIQEIKKQIAREFGEELSYEVPSDPTWDRKRFLSDHPDFECEYCEYCGMFPVSLHHLLYRNEHPEFTYEEENIVPLCLTIHGMITHKKWTPDLESEYDAAMRSWQKASSGFRKREFKSVMRKLHDFGAGKLTEHDK